MLSMPRIVRPDPHRFWRARNLGPPLDRPLADPLSETKNWRNLLTGRRGSQVSHSLPALLAKVGNINAEILAVLFRFRAPDFAKVRSPEWAALIKRTPENVKNH
jgi:hypothetical protein